MQKSIWMIVLSAFIIDIIRVNFSTDSTTSTTSTTNETPKTPHNPPKSDIPYKGMQAEVDGSPIDIKYEGDNSNHQKSIESINKKQYNSDNAYIRIQYCTS